MTTGQLKARMAKRSIKALLEGKTNVSWTIGVIKHSKIDKKTLKEMLDGLKHHGDGVRFRDLVEKCKSSGLL